MDIPTTRELELETLLRQKDSQLLQLNDEVLHLRSYLVNQPGPPTTEATTIPPALLSVLLPYFDDAVSATKHGSGSVNSALMQRAKVLQEENDELYNILRQGEMGKLKEEVRGLRRVVDRLETALRESHEAIQNLSNELDKSYDSLIRRNNSQQPSRSPHNSYRAPQHASSHSTNGNSKHPPTAPRAFKKPRLSDSSRLSPRPQHSPSSHSRRLSPGPATSSNSRAKMEIDEGARSPSEYTADYEKGRDHDRGRERDRGRDRQRGRERDKDKDKDRRRSGAGGRTSAGGPAMVNKRTDRGAVPSHSSFAKGDRTLAERMGL